MATSSQDSLETLEAMLHQERSGYQVHNYLQEVTSYEQSRGPLHHPPVDASCRFAMVQWCHNLVDYCQYSRETTAIAMSCLDRYLSTKSGFQTLLDRDRFQLAAMTALYTTAKVHEAQALVPDSISNLSRGKHQAHKVEEMESEMLFALEWRVNPPTATSFAKIYLDLIPLDTMDCESKENIFELVKYQLELALFDFDLCQYNASSLALAALVNALDSHNSDFADIVQTKLSEIVSETNLELMRRRLFEMVSQQSNSGAMRTVLAEAATKFSQRQQQRYHHQSPVSPKTETTIMSCDGYGHTESPRMVSTSHV